MLPKLFVRQIKQMLERFASQSDQLELRCHGELLPLRVNMMTESIGQDSPDSDMSLTPPGDGIRRRVPGEVQRVTLATVDNDLDATWAYLISPWCFAQSVERRFRLRCNPNGWRRTGAYAELFGTVNRYINDRQQFGVKCDSQTNTVLADAELGSVR